MRNLFKPKSLSMCFVFSVLSLNVWAGEASLMGYGEIQVAPEFITVTVSVKSECFKSASSVSLANDDVANNVLELLKSVAISSNGDKVTAIGGYVKRYTGYNSHRNEAVCVNAFRKENQLTFKTFGVKEFPEVFANLQDKIYELGMSTDASNVENPTSFLEIGLPSLGLTDESRKTYERKVLGMALQDAKDKFESTLALAGIQSYKIIGYSETGLPVRYNPDEDVRKNMADAPAAPIEFKDMTILKYLNVKFEFIGGDLDIL